MSEILPLSVDEVLTTTRAVRKRLDLERPVPRRLVEECLELALQAPNGSNQQRWGWVLVDDPALRSTMADVYRAALGEHVGRDRSGERPVDRTTSTAQRISSSVMHLVEHLHEVPVLLVPAFGGRVEQGTVFDQASHYGSILQSVWSFMLALRSRGLGSVWTTLHLRREREMAELLGIPYEGWTQVGLFPVAYTKGTEFAPGERQDLAAVAWWNGWRRA